jgi:hypothetical protein
MSRTAAAAVAAAGAVFLGLDNLFYTTQVLGLPTDKRISVSSLEAAAKKQCSLSWHAVKAQLAKQAGASKPQDDPYLLKVGPLQACFSSALSLVCSRMG